MSTKPAKSVAAIAYGAGRNAPLLFCAKLGDVFVELKIIESLCYCNGVCVMFSLNHYCLLPAAIRTCINK